MEEKNGKGYTHPLEISRLWKSRITGEDGMDDAVPRCVVKPRGEVRHHHLASTQDASS